MSRSSFRPAVIALAMTAVLAGPWAVPARAGGGMCHADLSEGTGTVVAMSKLCFRPAVIRVDPGSQVTFVNRDPVGHNVSANGWGEPAAMSDGDSFTATFAAPGVYPFACMFHPGMVGAVVVGEDLQAGSGDAVSAASAGGQPGGPDRDQVSLQTTPANGIWIGAGVLGGGLLVAGALGLARRRRPV
jgi:plastocyanin